MSLRRIAPLQGLGRLRKPVRIRGYVRLRREQGALLLDRPDALEAYAQQQGLLGASRPEIMVHQWLMARGEGFVYQFGLMGGRTQRGGAVGDFLLYQRHPPLVIRVQSEHWHPDPLREEEQRLALQAEGYGVVDVWEEEILHSVETAMTAALAGIELRRRG